MAGIFRAYALSLAVNLGSQLGKTELATLPGS